MYKAKTAPLATTGASGSGARRAELFPSARDDAKDAVIWQGRMSPWLIWFTAQFPALLFLPASFVLVPQLLRRIATDALPPGIAANVLLCAVIGIGLVMGIGALFLLVITPFGGIRAECRLTKTALVVETRLLAQRRLCSIRLQGLHIPPSGWARLTVLSPGDGWTAGAPVFLHRRDRQTLRAAMPEGAFT